MPNNNQSEEVERIVRKTVDEISHHLYEIDADRMGGVYDIIKESLTTHGASEYARGKSEERERIIKAIRADKNENAENGGEWANGYNAGKFISVNCALSQENTLKE